MDWRIEQFCSEILKVSDKQLARDLTACAKVSMQPKGTVLLRAGERQSQMHFLMSGFCRGYFIDEYGNDVTDCFAWKPGDPVIAANGLSGPSPISIETLETSEIISIPMEDQKNLMERYPVLHQVELQMLQEAFNRHWEAKWMLYQHTALQRYQWFCRAYPGVIDRVKHAYVASFLHMTPVTLSRLRRELRESGGVMPGQN